jgi:hypothetical protein
VAITAATSEFLVEARRDGVRFDRTLTIGRQTLFVGPRRLARTMALHGIPSEGRTESSFRESFRRAPWMSDAFLEALGANDLAAMDGSDYEGADLLHNLNEPVPADLHERFDVVFDGGTLEHVFDIRTALRNYMSMVKVGGRLIVLTMANNHMGHGFYQLSPTLFYRALSEPNGYVVERMQLAVEDVEYVSVGGVSVPIDLAGGGRYDVADPEAVGERVLLRTRRGVCLLVQARRTSATEPLAVAPVQDDYASLWARSAAPPDDRPARGPLRRLFRRAATEDRMMDLTLDVLPRIAPVIAPLARAREARHRSLSNRRVYRRVDSPGAAARRPSR